MKTIHIMITDENGVILDNEKLEVPDDYGIINVQALGSDIELPTWNNPFAVELTIGKNNV